MGKTKWIIEKEDGKYLGVLESGDGTTLVKTEPRPNKLLVKKDITLVRGSVEALVHDVVEMDVKAEVVKPDKKVVKKAVKKTATKKAVAKKTTKGKA